MRDWERKKVIVNNVPFSSTHTAESCHIIHCLSQAYQLSQALIRMPWLQALIASFVFSTASSTPFLALSAYVSAVSAAASAPSLPFCSAFSRTSSVLATALSPAKYRATIYRVNIVSKWIWASKKSTSDSKRVSPLTLEYLLHFVHKTHIE